MYYVCWFGFNIVFQLILLVNGIECSVSGGMEIQESWTREEIREMEFFSPSTINNQFISFSSNFFPFLQLPWSPSGRFSLFSCKFCSLFSLPFPLNLILYSNKERKEKFWTNVISNCIIIVIFSFSIRFNYSTSFSLSLSSYLLSLHRYWTHLELFPSPLPLLCWFAWFFSFISPKVQVKLLVSQER